MIRWFAAGWLVMFLAALPIVLRIERRRRRAAALDAVLADMQSAVDAFNRQLGESLLPGVAEDGCDDDLGGSRRSSLRLDPEGR